MIYILVFAVYIGCSVLTWCLLCGGLSWAYKNIWTSIQPNLNDYILTGFFSLMGPSSVIGVLVITTIWMERPRLSWTINTKA